MLDREWRVDFFSKVLFVDCCGCFWIRHRAFQYILRCVKRQLYILPPEKNGGLTCRVTGNHLFDSGVDPPYYTLRKFIYSRKDYLIMASGFCRQRRGDAI